MANNWRLQAKCRALNHIEADELFFPSSGRAVKAAIKFCNTGCPVQEECLNFAIEKDIHYGIWAGLKYKERLAVKKFQDELNGIPVTNPREKKVKMKRSGFKLA